MPTVFPVQSIQFIISKIVYENIKLILYKMTNGFSNVKNEFFIYTQLTFHSPSTRSFQNDQPKLTTNNNYLF